NRPLLVMRSNLWASGYDVDGTDQTSLGQFSGRVQQTYKHSVPRFFVPEHGTMFTLALVRFPPTATKEIQYLNAKDRKSGSAGMPRPISYAVFCLKKKIDRNRCEVVKESVKELVLDMQVVNNFNCMGFVHV